MRTRTDIRTGAGEKKMELPRQLGLLSRSRSFFSKRIETALSDLH